LIQKLTQKRNLEECVRCGKCLPHCPTYRFYLREDFSPRGRNFLLSKGIESEGILHCFLCGRCKSSCPLGVSFPSNYLKRLIENSTIDEGRPFSFPPIKDLLFWKDFFPSRKVLSLDEKLFSPKEGDFYLYLSCGLRHLYPEALGKFSLLLKKAGLKALAPQASCCGIFYLSLKDFRRLKEFAQENLLVFSQEKPIITFCATCLWMFKEVYPLLSTEFKELSQRTYFVLEFLVKEVGIEVQMDDLEGLYLHLPCHLKTHGLSNLDLTLSILGLNNKIKDFCCGSARADLLFKGFQKEYRRLWLKDLTGVNVLATACTGCFYNFTTLLQPPPIVKHWLEILNSR